MRTHEVDWSGLGNGRVAVCCEWGNEPSTSIKYGLSSWIAENLLASQEGLCSVEEGAIWSTYYNIVSVLKTASSLRELALLVEGFVEAETCGIKYRENISTQRSDCCCFPNFVYMTTVHFNSCNKHHFFDAAFEGKQDDSNLSLSRDCETKCPVYGVHRRPVRDWAC